MLRSRVHWATPISILERKRTRDVEISSDDLDGYVLGLRGLAFFHNPCKRKAIGSSVFKCRLAKSLNIGVSGVFYGVRARRRRFPDLIGLVKTKHVSADTALEYGERHDLGWQ